MTDLPSDMVTCNEAFMLVHDRFWLWIQPFKAAR